jgi:hypothetical protein
MDLDARLQTLTTFLSAHRPLWADRPFHALPCSWEADHPALAAWLRTLHPDEIDQIEQDSRRAWLHAPAPYRDWDTAIRDLCEVPDVPLQGLSLARAQALEVQVPGRKWAQIEAFARAVLPLAEGRAEGWLDWCAGKGHLGRTLSALSGLPSRMLERSAHLCAAGDVLAERAGVDCHFVQADVLSPDAWRWIEPGAAAVGLHACGVLTDTLLLQAAKREAQLIAAAPCCFHALGGVRDYEWRSETGRRAGLALTSGDLRLATAEETRARAGLRRYRRDEMAWRLGYDLLLREATGEDAYTPLGTLGAELLRLPFSDFCRALATERGHRLPLRWDGASAEAAGRERSRLARALGLVRCLFRRPLELAVVIDKALGLAETGRTVQIGQFCPPEVTPRNLLIWSVR